MKNLSLIFSGGVEMRWIDTYFPFTNPSFELEIYFQVFNLFYFILQILVETI